VALLGCRPAGGVVATYRSPAGRYYVQLVGKSTAPKALFVEHLLYANAFRNSSEIVRDWEIHFADMLDTAFDDEYEKPSWEAENILRFKTSGVASAESRDLIVVRNHGTQPVALLTVKAADLILAFDLSPGDVLELTAPSQGEGTDLSWLKVEGKWANGQHLRSSGVNFELPPRPRGQFKYVVHVRDTATDIVEVQQGARIYR
jgi:hypothetical protein